MSDEKNLAARILNARKNVPILRWYLEGFGVIYIHGLTGIEKVKYLEDCVNSNNGIGTPETAEVKLLQLCVRDEEGKRLFKFIDIPKLLELPAVMITTISDACARLSGIHITDLMPKTALQDRLLTFSCNGIPDGVYSTCNHVLDAQQEIKDVKLNYKKDLIVLMEG